MRQQFNNSQLQAIKELVDRLSRPMNDAYISREECVENYLANFEELKKRLANLESPYKGFDEEELEETAICYLAEINDYGRDDFPEGRYSFEIHELVKVFKWILDHSTESTTSSSNLQTESLNTNETKEGDFSKLECLEIECQHLRTELIEATERIRELESELMKLRGE